MTYLKLLLVLGLAVGLAGCAISLASDIKPPAESVQSPESMVATPTEPVASSDQELKRVENTESTSNAALSASRVNSSDDLLTPVPVIPSSAVISTTWQGTVSGLVTNGSGGQVPQDLVVTLRGYEPDDIHVKNVITQTTVLQGDSKYTFNAVPLSAGRIYLATIDYQGVSYDSEAVTVNPGDQALDLPIQLFESTTDLSSLVVDRLHVFIDRLDEQNLRIVELWIISNPGRLTVRAEPAGAPNVTFQLPVGATNLQFQDGVLGGRYLKTEHGFADTQPVDPGEGTYQVVFAYDLPFHKKIELAQPLDLPITAWVVVAPANSFQISGVNLVDEGVSTMQAQTVHLYRGASLQAGEILQMTVRDAPFYVRWLAATDTRNNLLIGLGALGVALLLLGGMFYLRGRQSTPRVAVNGNGLPAMPEDEPEALMDAILALDDFYKAGKLSLEPYQKRRALLKERLKDLLDQEKS